jgi:hypothetical protein
MEEEDRTLTVGTITCQVKLFSDGDLTPFVGPLFMLVR